MEVVEQDGTRVIIINNNNNNNNNNNSAQNQFDESKSDFFGAKFALKQALKSQNGEKFFDINTYNLSSFQKNLMYESLKKNGILPSILNIWLFAFGAGSFIQGDTFGGWLEILTFWGGVVLSSRNSTVGSFLVLGGWVFGLIRPHVYANAYNNRLQRALYAQQSKGMLESQNSFLAVQSINNKWEFEIPLFAVNF